MSVSSTFASISRTGDVASTQLREIHLTILASLLLIVVDEPELGLHPYALNVVASLFQTASHHTQVLVSTQSSSFLDSFDPEDIVVVERDGEATKFKRPDATKLEAWLEAYTLGEVWEKNVIGGGPH